MNIKDRQMILYYLRNAMNSDYEPEDMDETLHRISSFSQDLFGFKIQHIVNEIEKRISVGDMYDFVSNLLNGVLYRNVLLSEDAIYNRISSIFETRKSDFSVDVTSPDFDKSFTVICDTFDLSEDYRKMLQFWVCMRKFTAIRRLLCRFNDGVHDDLMDDANAEFVATICKVPTDKVKDALSKTGPLVDAGIIIYHFGDNTFSPMFSSLLTMTFNSTKEVRDVLIGSPLSTNLKRENFDYMADDFDKLSDILSGSIVNDKKGTNILLYGRPGTGKTELAKTLCDTLGLSLYTTSEKQAEKDARLSNLANLQTVLKNDGNSVILFDEAEDVFSLSPFSKYSPSKLYINRILENNKRPVIWITNNINDVDKAYIRRFTLALEMADPDERAKMNTWRRVFQKYELEISDSELKRLANKYQVPISVIDTAVKNAKMVNDCIIIDYTIDKLVQAMTGKLPRQKKPNDVKFDTQLLNTDTNLEQLAQRIKDTNIKSFSLCLYGAPGTGKTAFCEYLADMLEMQIIKKRASDINGPFVGQTEQNIARAFQEAHAQKAILVFDEADSFLMDRKHAQRSWEVASVNEMLTQMESADIPFVCTTNLMDNIDQAALRRFSFKVKYNFLTPNQVITAFQDFFGQTVERGDVADLVNLAPGDFVVVKKQADLLGITDKSELIAKLRAEQAAKKLPNSKSKIGF